MAMPQKMSKDPRCAAVSAYGYQQRMYGLERGPHLFVDWRYIDPGRVRWETAGGDEAPLWSCEPVDGVRGVSIGNPSGIRLVPQPVEKIGPVIANDREWEFMLFYCCMLDLGGKYGMWYEAVPPRGNGARSFLCYAESTDGLNWVKPDLGIYEFNGSKRNNIVIAPEQCPYGTFHGSSVFIDPDAAPEERFKIVYWATALPEEVVVRLKSERPESVDAYGEAKKCSVMLGASPDGLHWTLKDDLLFCHTSDTQTVMEHDPFLRRYVCYTRSFQLGRRSIARTESEDITKWPIPEVILWTPQDSDPADDIYLNSKCIYPGTKNMHVMFPTMYKRRVDGCALRMATSLDNHTWQWLPGEVMQCGTEGTWDSGCFLTGAGLVEIAGDRVALPYAGYEFPHKYPRYGRMGQIGLATWQKERLCALQADEDAEFWTVPLNPRGNELYLNFDTKRAGFIKVEVIGVDGRTLADSDPLSGNVLKKQVTWKGNGALGVSSDQPVTLHFAMRCARLFSFEIR